MPSYRVTERSLSLSIFDVVGKDGDAQNFIGHAALAASAGSQQATEIPVLDMGPPLHGRDETGRLSANIVGSATLTDDEVQKIRTFVDRHANEHHAFQKISRSELLKTAPQMYCVRPHMIPFYEEDGRYTRMRFSCAGFVFEAYRMARIKLLDSNALPPVDFEVIKLAYPTQVRMMENERIKREDLGLEGEGPWHVMLCGYLFHALNRNADIIRRTPYTPSIVDQHFPDK